MKSSAGLAAAPGFPDLRSDIIYRERESYGASLPEGMMCGRGSRAQRLSGGPVPAGPNSGGICGGSGRSGGIGVLPGIGGSLGGWGFGSGMGAGVVTGGTTGVGSVGSGIAILPAGLELQPDDSRFSGPRGAVPLPMAWFEVPHCGRQGKRPIGHPRLPARP